MSSEERISTPLQRARSILSWLLGLFKRSLATRILLVFIVTSLLITALLLTMIIKGFSTQWRTNVSPHLAQYLNYVNADIGDPPDIERAKELANELPINIYITGPELSFTSTGQALDLADLEFDDDQRRFGKRYRRANDLSEYKVQIGEHQDRTVLRSEVGDFQIYYELSHSGKRGHRDGVVSRTILSILALLGLCYLVLRYMLRPVQDIKTGVNKMGAGELNYRVPVRAANDLGELAGSINTMADDIEKMLDAKRQLLLGVSHELRSPLTRANVAVQLLDESAYTKQIRDDLQEMEGLITEILETERINTSHAVIHRSPIDVRSVAAAVVAELTSDDIEIKSGSDTVTAELDEPRLRLLLRNMLSNALKHGGDAERKPVLSLARDGDFVVIEMADFGPGIAPEHLHRVTEPFYRADPSRTRATGGFGIGLYLCKLIAEAHQGELLISSTSGQGTSVTARLQG